MTFTYTYRSSDGQRHSAEIEAESRDDAFARVRRELGIKPIKVVAEAEGPASRRDAEKIGDVKPGSVARRALFATAVGLAVAGGIAAWLWAKRPANAPYQVMTPQGPVTYMVAAPLARQTIPGDRQRIEASRATAFQSPAEAWLARFAEPGRHVGESSGRAEPVEGRRPHAPAREDFEACLKEPVRIASTDFTEAVDLKRIVTGMKREMKAYLAGGGTVEGYLAELEKRQRLEISYRERAEQKLNELLADAQKQPHPSSPKATDGTSSTPNPQLSTAYSYWLKANAQLQAMGIYQLAIPDSLRSYQMGMDIDE